MCESLLDALAFWSAGFRHVTSAYGVNGFTEELEEAVVAAGVERVLIAFDRDEAGEAGARKVAERLLARGIGCYRVQFPRGMDANEYALRVQPPERLPQEARPISDPEPRERLSAPAPPPAEPPPTASPPEPPAPSSSLAAPAATPPTLLTAPPAPAVPMEVSEREVSIRLGDRRYRVRGLAKNLSYDVMKVNLLAGRTGSGDGFHVDTLDLYSARQRSAFIKQAAAELGVEPRVVQGDVGRVLLRGAGLVAMELDGGDSDGLGELPAEASPVPAPPPPAPPAVVKGQEVVISLGDRRYRVRGLPKNLAYDVLKINLLASRRDAFHVDTLDLYSARHRAVFQKAAAGELGLDEAVIKTDLGKVLLKLEELQDEQIRAALEPKTYAVELADEEKAEALALLSSPDLLARILEDFERCGVVGEETNKLMGYLAATSRLLERPLAVVVQSSSSAGSGR